MDAPLAERLRPSALEEVVGQGHLLGPNGPLRRIAEGGRLPSMVLWGPPGTGKTTLARILANATGHGFLEFSGVTGTAAGSSTVGSATGHYRIAVEFFALLLATPAPALYRPWKAVFALLLYPVKWLDPLLRRSPEGGRIAGGWYVVATKPDAAP